MQFLGFYFHYGYENATPDQMRVDRWAKRRVDVDISLVLSELEKERLRTGGELFRMGEVGDFGEEGAL
jgi:hypothetical protein